MKQQKPSGHHEKLPSTFADFLKSKREELGLNRTDMALKLEISRTQLTRLEAGVNKRPSPTLLMRLLKLKEIREQPGDLYALAGYIPPSDLPAFVPYLRAMHPDWTDETITMLDQIHDFLCKHSLS
jgi:transcriptional regulator with XRE-family HTH domain